MERKHDTTFLAQYLKEHAGKAAKRLQKVCISYDN